MTTAPAVFDNRPDPTFISELPILSGTPLATTNTSAASASSIDTTAETLAEPIPGLALSAMYRMGERFASNVQVWFRLGRCMFASSLIHTVCVQANATIVYERSTLR